MSIIIFNLMFLYFGYGAELLAKIERGEYFLVKENSPKIKGGNVSTFFKEDPYAAISIIILFLFFWPLFDKTS